MQEKALRLALNYIFMVQQPKVANKIPQILFESQNQRKSMTFFFNDSPTNIMQLGPF
jgi:hypothetical protein